MLAKYLFTGCHTFVIEVGYALDNMHPTVMKDKRPEFANSSA